MLRVIREDEVLAATLGRRPMAYRSKVTIVSWTMAAAAGILFAYVVGYIAPTSFLVTDTFLVWTAVILGGPGRNIGVVIGAAILILLSVSTRFLAAWSGLPSDLVANLRLAVFGLVLVLMFLFRPEGLFPETRKVRDVDGR
jgi:branched-chain amino acid transport system permease protein